MPLTPITKENGPFFYLKDYEYKSRFFAFKENNKYEDEWKNGRVDNKTILESSKEIGSFLEMYFGSTLLIDTVNIYHKGGFCRSKNRFILHISYQGSSWTSTKPQNFERELNHLKKTTSNIKKIKILRKEFEAYKKFKN